MLAGVGITLLVLVLNALSNIILVVAAERLQVFDLGGVLGHLPGPWGRSLRLFFDASIWFSVGLTLVGYLVVVADALESWHLPKTYGLALGAAVALPLSFLEPKYLAFSSSLSVGANVYLVGLIAVLFSYKRGAARGVLPGRLWTWFDHHVQCIDAIPNLSDVHAPDV